MSHASAARNTSCTSTYTTIHRPPELGGRKGRGRGAHRRVPRPPQAVSHLKQLAHRVAPTGLSVGSTAGLIWMTLHAPNIKGLEQPHRQPTEQNKPRQTTRKGRTGGTDGRQFGLTPTVKAAPFAALRTHPVATCERHSVAQSGCAASRQPGLAK